MKCLRVSPFVLILLLLCGPLAAARATPAAHFAAIRALAWSEDGQLLASASDDGAVKIWQPVGNSLSCVALWVTGNDAISSVAFSPDGALVAIGDSAGVSLWKWRQNSVRSLKNAPAPARSLAWSQKGILAVGGEAGALWLCQTATGKTWNAPATETVAVTALDWDASGTRLAASYDGKGIAAWNWNPDAAKPLLPLFQHLQGAGNLAWSRDGRLLAVADWQRVVKIWNGNDGSISRLLVGHQSWASLVSFANDGTLWSASWDNSIRAWNSSTGENVSVLPARGRLLCLAASSGRLATGDEDGTLWLWNLREKHSFALAGLPPSPSPTVRAYVAYSQGSRAWDDGHQSAALTELRTAIHLDESRPAYRIKLAQVLRGIGQFQNSEWLLRASLARFSEAAPRRELTSELAETFVVRALVLATRHDNERAALYYSRAIALQPAWSPVRRSNLLAFLAEVVEIDSPRRAPQIWQAAIVALQAPPPAKMASSEYKNGGETPSAHALATLWVNLGDAHLAIGQPLRAQSDFEAALRVLDAPLAPLEAGIVPAISPAAARDGGEEAAARNGLGLAWRLTGRAEEALTQLEWAYEIHKQRGSTSDAAIALNNLGVICQQLALYGRAVRYFSMALALHQQNRDSRETAVTLVNIGANHHFLGQYAAAISFYSRALPLFQKVAAPKKNTVRDSLPSPNSTVPSVVLGNIGHAYLYSGKIPQALNYARQALRTAQQSADKSALGTAQVNLAQTLVEANQLTEALVWARRAQQTGRETNDIELQAIALWVQSRVAAVQKNWTVAIQRANAALLILARQPSPVVAIKIHAALMDYEMRTGRTGLAIFYGQRAVDLSQKLRGDLSNLDVATQKDFLRVRAPIYRQLAQLLIQQGRMLEVQQIMRMLHETETLDFLREVPSETKIVPTNDREEQSAQQYTALQEDIAVSGRRYVELSRQLKNLPLNDARRPVLQKEQKDLELQITNINMNFVQFLNKLPTLFQDIKETRMAARRRLEEVTSFSAALGQLGDDVVAICPIIGKDNLSLAVYTSSIQMHVEPATPITANQLNVEIWKFRCVLQNRALDPRPQAALLYNILVRPIQPFLNKMKAKTLLWALDGGLRYIPMSALYDEKTGRYLVEDYQSAAIYSNPQISNYLPPPSTSWQVLGCGATHFPKDIEPLPEVQSELLHIIHEEGDSPAKGEETGILAGKRLLDNSFTKENFFDTLSHGQYQVLHIASHFNLQPGNDEESYLLLGGEERLTLDEFRAAPQLTALLPQVDLVTLSACNTALAVNLGDGEEIDGLAGAMQQKGAKAVLASLWSVADSSTSSLMSKFYRECRSPDGSPNLSKTAALRAAQIALLTGDFAPSATRSRGQQWDSLDGYQISAPPFPYDAKKPFAHPFYWAPFILLGNPQ